MLIDLLYLCRPKYYAPRNPYPTSQYYPTTPLSVFDNPMLFEKFGLDSLFFIFYYQQGTYQQYVSAQRIIKSYPPGSIELFINQILYLKDILLLANWRNNPGDFIKSIWRGFRDMKNQKQWLMSTSRERIFISIMKVLGVSERRRNSGKCTYGSVLFT